MIIKRFTLKILDNNRPPSVINVVVPLGSKLRKAILIPGSIQLAYEVSEIESNETRIDKYTILDKPEQHIPDEATFVDLLSYIFQVPDKPEQQAIVLFPIYKLN